ncbi:von Willebrand factor C and EGF domain-containing protein-like [Gigantopelta aegis]|uniref:von Willebrand factor C and EGF domain-containing protein-like n=1 Tax=Gigantopelta aegis TaxID=1735272 RepID=UPI001B88DFA7|nr:von Willebrand factor C and EGF domain-containing protein-like [Gigantopelta aegis]
MDLIVLSWLVLCGTHLAAGEQRACTYSGVVYHPGDHWVARDGCNGCTCTNYGTECGGFQCTNNNALGTPGDYLCYYNDKYYSVHQQWTAVDHCNTCTCTPRGMQCTIKPCKNTGFATPQVGRLGDCNYHGSWYLHLDQWLARGGCNTCVCALPGNYLGLQICTENKCSDVNVGK